jgi:class 3 adenylate cyclase
VFGAPLDDPDHARHAVVAALACQERLRALGDRLSFRPGRHPETRIGLNTGPALVGNIGSAHRMSYTVMGDTVNLAARLEGANKLYGTRVLCSETTAEACGHSLVLREIDRVRVLGRTTPTRLFEPLGGPSDPDAQAGFDAARTAFAAGRFREAAEAFEALARNDPVASKLARRAQRFAEEPPAAWDGVIDLDHK